MPMINTTGKLGSFWRFSITASSLPSRLTDHYTDNSHLGIHEASDIPIFTFSYLYYFASLHAAGLARSGRPVYVHWNRLANTRLK